MITSEQWKRVEKQASQLYSQLELEIIGEIAERIASVGYANTVVLNNIEIVQEMGILYQDIVSLVAKYNNTSVSKIQKIFEEAGAKSIAFDDVIYKEAGLNPIPFKQSKMMLKLLEVAANRTSNNLNNLAMTTVDTSQTEFYNAMNKAYLEVSTGVKSYSQSIIDTISELSKKSTKVKYPSGYETSIENAVRMNIITSVNQACGKLQEMRADELGWDLMEITAHAGARPSHAEWQGQVVSRSGQAGYLNLSDIEYGEVTGFKGVNCRHDWMPFHEGSTRTYTDNELEDLKNETVMYNNKKISKYEASQIQRKMERIIRADKKELAGLQGALKSATDEILINETNNKFNLQSFNLKQHENNLKDFLNQIEFKNDKSRQFVAEFNRSTSQKAVHGAKTIENNRNILYNSNIPLGQKLGFKDNLGRMTFIPKNAEITNIIEIAGKDTKEFRIADWYVQKYGGTVSDWSKRAGKIESDKYIFDIHWVQSKNGIICDWKIKNKTLKEGI